MVKTPSTKLANFDRGHPLRGLDGAMNSVEPTHIDASHLHVIVETSHSLIGKRVHVFEAREAVEYRGIAIRADSDSAIFPCAHYCVKNTISCSKHTKTVLILQKTHVSKNRTACKSVCFCGIFERYLWVFLWSFLKSTAEHRRWFTVLRFVHHVHSHATRFYPLAFSI